MTKFQPFTTKTMHKMQGLKETIDECLTMATCDCLKRPAESAGREITIKLILKTDENEPDNVIVASQVSLKIPTRKVVSYKMATSQVGELRFQPSFPHDPHQQELDGFDDEAEDDKADE